MKSKLLSLLILICLTNIQNSLAQFIELPAPGLPYQGSHLPYMDAAVTYPSEPNGFVYSGHEFMDVPDCYTYTDKLYEYNGVTDQWSIFADVPDMRVNPVVFILNGQHYYGMGENNGSPVNDLWIYDAGSLTWTPRPVFPGAAKSNMIIFTHNTSAYFVSGSISNQNFSHECWEYNSVTASWTQKNNFPGTARVNGKAWTIDTLNYIGLGQDSSSQHLNDIWLYDAVNDNWIMKNNFPSTISYNGNNFTLNNTAYFHTGLEFYSYDADSDFWSPQNNFADTILYGLSFCSDNKGYILTDTNLYRYDPLSANWTTVYSDTLGSLYGSNAIVIGNKAHISNRIYDLSTGIWSDDTTGSSWLFKCNGKGYALHHGNFESFDPASQLWTPVTLPPVSINSLTSLFDIADTSYFVFTDSVSVVHTLEYNCAADNWSMYGQVPYIADVSFSIGNKGYMGLGWNDSIGWSTKLFYEYDPVSSTWTQKADFPGHPRYNAIGLSANGKGYVGLGKEEAVINPVDPVIYTYDPQTDSWTTFGALTPRVAGFSFSDGNTIYIGNGYKRVSMSCGGVSYRDFYKSDSSFTTNINSLTDNDNPTVYPNPASSGEELFLNNFQSRINFIQLFDIQGRSVCRFNKPNGNHVTLPAGIKNGIYILKIGLDKGENKIIKLMILK